MKWEFWQWFFLGLKGHSGLRRLLLNGWILFHAFVGFLMATLVRVPIQEASQTILLPLAGIFVGLSFAWAANAQALLSEPEIEKLAEYLPDGISTYIFTFQLAILVILITLVAWGLAGLGVFEARIFYPIRIQFSIEWALYFLSRIQFSIEWALYFLSRHYGLSPR